MKRESPNRFLNFDANAGLAPGPRVRAALRTLLRTPFGNPSSAHTEGRAARRLLESARDQVARALDCAPAEVVFTGSGTEANLTALHGLAAAAPPDRRRVLCSPIEHPSIRHGLALLETRGFRVESLPLDPTGALSVPALRGTIDRDVALVTVQAANHETGVLQPVAEVSELCRTVGASFHTDAVQAFGKVPFSFRTLGCSTATVSGFKIGALPGVGALAIRAGLSLPPLIPGEQERSRRGGTENLFGIASLGAAAEGLPARIETMQKRVRPLVSGFLATLKRAVRGLAHHGDFDRSTGNTLMVSFPDIDNGFLVATLDRMGVGVSTGAACSSGAARPSATLLAMGVDPEVARTTLRFSFSPTLARRDLDRALVAIREAVLRLAPDRAPRAESVARV